MHITSAVIQIKVISRFVMMLGLGKLIYKTLLTTLQVIVPSFKSSGYFLIPPLLSVPDIYRAYVHALEQLHPPSKCFEFLNFVVWLLKLNVPYLSLIMN